MMSNKEKISSSSVSAADANTNAKASVAPDHRTTTIPPRGFALFDLDHTILPFDTQVYFCNFVLKKEGWRRLYLLLFLPLAPLAAIGVMPLRTAKRIFSSYLWKMPRARLNELVQEFVDTVFEKVAYPEIVDEIEKNRDGGRILVLNSASPAFYVEAIADKLGFDHWYATALEVSDPMPLMPRVLGPNNKHGAKIDAMKDALPIGFDAAAGDVLPDSVGYTDSTADLPLLSICKRGVIVHPGEELAAKGEESGWSVRKPERPYATATGGKCATLLQLLGLYPLPEAEDAE